MEEDRASGKVRLEVIDERKLPSSKSVRELNHGTVEIIKVLGWQKLGGVEYPIMTDTAKHSPELQELSIWLFPSLTVWI